MTKSQLAVIDDLQNNPDYIILNNLFAIPNFVRLAAKQKKERNEIYTPKIFFEIVSQLTPKHLECVGEYVSVEFSVGDFLTAIASTNSNNDYNHVISCVKKMQQITVEFENEKVIAGFSVIPYYKYEKGDKTMRLDIRKELAQAVLTVKQSENFSFLKKYLFLLNNAQAIKLFPYFMSWRNRGMVEMTLEQFKKRFGYETEGYDRFSNLKLRVLDPALVEINAKTDLQVSYKLLGTNLTSVRPRIIGIQFFIKEKANQQQLPQAAAVYTPVEVVKTTAIQPKITTVKVPNLTASQAENPYSADILRVFQMFEPQSTSENVQYFLSAFEDTKAVLEACLYAEQEQLKKHEIKNFRGYLVAGIRKGLGFGILEQRTKDQAKAQQVEQNKTNQADKAAELENLLKEAEILRGGYRTEMDTLLQNTPTNDKENVAAILRKKRFNYATRTLKEFESTMFIADYLDTFIATYPERFGAVHNTYKKASDVLAAKIKKLDPTKAKNLFHY
jgi:plasmid replication initiation protein